MPTAQKTGDFCFDHVVTDDGAVAFLCSSDREKWPWLALHPANNTLIQLVNYYSLTSVSAALGRLDPEKWTALTSFTWRVYKTESHATHGQADAKQPDDDGPGYAASFFDSLGDLVYRFRGEGVVFRNRDFEAWRAKSKSQALALPKPEGFTYASPAAAGVAAPVECFVSPLQESAAGKYCDALITKETGFPPAHPWHDGSGDHVNSGHLCDASQQCAALIRGQAGLRGYPAGGEVQFKRYVELERPFRISLVSDVEMLESLQLKVEQGGRPCAEITFRYGA